MDDSEIFKPVVGYEGFYEVSNKGTVISLRGNRKILTNKMDSKGYFFHQLCRSATDHKQHRAHRLVAAAFIGPATQDRFEVNHKNGNKTDNRLKNLEYVSHRENAIHGIEKLGSSATKPRGTRHHWSKLDNDTVKKIRETAKRMTYAELRKVFPFAHNTLWSVVNKRTWAHVV